MVCAGFRPFCGRVSIYSELLVGLCADLDPLRLPPDRDELVVILLQRRRTGRGHEIDERHDIADGLALELDRDRMLLRLATAVGIETDPALFASPLPERRRLEELLGEAGVDFWTLEDNRRVAVS